MASQLIEQVDAHIAIFCLTTQQEARPPFAGRCPSCAERARALRPSRLGKGVLCHSSQWVIRRKERPRASSDKRLMLNEIRPHSHALSRRGVSTCRRSSSPVACGPDLHLLLHAIGSQQNDASCASSHLKRVNEGTDGRRSQLAQIELEDELNGSRCVQDEEAAGWHRDHAADGQSRASR